MDMDFVVVDLSCTHNVILEKLALEDLGVVISIEHLAMKFKTPTRVRISQCNQKVTRDCYL